MRTHHRAVIPKPEALETAQQAPVPRSREGEAAHRVVAADPLHDDARAGAGRRLREHQEDAVSPADDEAGARGTDAAGSLTYVDSFP